MSGVPHSRTFVLAVLGLVGLAGLARGETPPQKGDRERGRTVQVPPVVEWSTPEGGVRPERGGTWTFAAPPRGGDSGTSDRESTSPHQVVFLLDVSASMPSVHGGRFDEVVDDVRRRAREMIEPYRETDLLEISLYRFGDLRETDGGQWVPHVREFREGRDVGPEAALSVLDEYFTADRDVYEDDYTYVAASVYEAIRRELELSDRPTPVSIPSDAPAISVLAFTDTGNEQLGGGESHRAGRDYDHEPYSRWLEKHRRRHQLQYYHWNLETESYPELPGEGKIVYSARWPDAGRVETLNRGAAVRDRERELDVTRTVTLTPELLSSDPGDAAVCSERDERERVDLPRRPLDVSLTGLPTFNIGAVESYAAGKHPVRFPRDELCSQLAAAYADSEFRLPRRDGELQRLGYVEVVDEARYTMAFGADGTRADAPLPDLSADRLHRYDRRAREYFLEAPELEEADVEVSWSGRVLREGESLPDPSGLYALDAEGVEPGLEVETAAGQRVELRVPGRRQRWWTMGRDFPFAPGNYEVELCATPKVSDAPDEDYGLVFDCDGCDKPTGEGERSVCARIRTTVRERPIAWWWIALAGALISIVLWAVFRWIRSPKFPDGLVITVEHAGPDDSAPIRYEKTVKPSAFGSAKLGNTVDLAVQRFLRRPYFVLVYENADPTFHQTPPLEYEGYAAAFAVQRVVGTAEINVWICHVDDEFAEVTLEESRGPARRVEPVGSFLDLSDKKLHRVGVSKLIDREFVVRLHRPEGAAVEVTFWRASEP